MAGDRARWAAQSAPSFCRILEVGQAGDDVGCLLRGVRFDEVQRGQVLALPGSESARRLPSSRPRCTCWARKKADGARGFCSGYNPQFFFRLANVTGVTRPLGDIDMCMPGEGVKLAVTLYRPVISA